MNIPWESPGKTQLKALKPYQLAFMKHTVGLVKRKSELKFNDCLLVLRGIVRCLFANSALCRSVCADKSIRRLLGS